MKPSFCLRKPFLMSVAVLVGLSILADCSRPSSNEKSAPRSTATPHSSPTLGAGSESFPLSKLPSGLDRSKAVTGRLGTERMLVAVVPYADKNGGPGVYVFGSAYGADGITPIFLGGEHYKYGGLVNDIRVGSKLTVVYGFEDGSSLLKTWTLKDSKLVPDSVAEQTASPDNPADAATPRAADPADEPEQRAFAGEASPDQYHPEIKTRIINRADQPDGLAVTKCDAILKSGGYTTIFFAIENRTADDTEGVTLELDLDEPYAGQNQISFPIGTIQANHMFWHSYTNRLPNFTTSAVCSLSSFRYQGLRHSY